MGEIQGKAKTVRELLKGVQYSIDYYQREYKWQAKQIRELVNDLTGKFFEEYDPDHPRNKVAEYPHYFLGSIILSKKDGEAFLVDGQQRLTSLILLLIKLRNMQKGNKETVNVDELIVSEKYGQRSFNLRVDERIPCMDALFNEEDFDPSERTESVQNLYARYHDLEECIPDDMDAHALPYFVDWLLENVHLVEITAFTDDDAYMIFETMNDRGLSLSNTEMLKGYLLASISDQAMRTEANKRWRDRIHLLNEDGKDTESDFFKTWLRSQYAMKIRERRKGAVPEDFDRIGTEFHRWLRENSGNIGLKESSDYFRFIDCDYDFYSRVYLRLMQASREPIPGLEHVLYNAQQGFTLQHHLLMAPLKPSDSEESRLKKLRLTARYLDILLTWRIWNFRSIAYSTMQYAIFRVMRDIRSLDVKELAQHLYDELMQEKETFTTNSNFKVHQQNRYALHRLLARLTDYVETQSGKSSRYMEYVADGKERYEIEHIWANHSDLHLDDFNHEADFSEYRNHIGGLLLLPKKINASYGDLPYEEKLKYYISENLLAQSLHPLAYERNPGFRQFIEKSNLPFHPYVSFKKADFEERGDLYRRLAERVWNPKDLLAEVDV